MGGGGLYNASILPKENGIELGMKKLAERVAMKTKSYAKYEMCRKKPCLVKHAVVMIVRFWKFFNGVCRPSANALDIVWQRLK